MLTHTKRFFQLSGITLFASMLVLGAAATASADHDRLTGKTVIKEECHNGTDKPIKTTIKSVFQIFFDPSSGNLPSKNGGNTLFPAQGLFQIHIFDFDGENLSESFYDVGDAGGVALSKNLKKGTFQVIMDNNSSATVGNRVLSLSGTVVANKDGDGKKVVGKINGHDTANDCIYVGKFKGK